MILSGFSKHEEPPRRKRGPERKGSSEWRFCHIEGSPHVDFLVQTVRDRWEIGDPMEFVARLLEWHPFSLPLILHFSSFLLCKPNCQHLFGWTDLWWQLGDVAALLDKWYIKPQSPGTAERLLPPNIHATQWRTKGTGWTRSTCGSWVTVSSIFSFRWQLY